MSVYEFCITESVTQDPIKQDEDISVNAVLMLQDKPGALWQALQAFEVRLRDLGCTINVKW